MDIKKIIEKPVMEFYEEIGHLRIELMINGVREVRYLAREDAEAMLSYIGAKSCTQLVTV
jgi:hypothetical protein